MEPKSINKYKRAGPESIIQDDLKDFLERRGWYVIVTHGSEFQMGLPDLYCAHYEYGVRWVEVKNPEKYSFTSAQRQVFPALMSKGVGIWILTGANEYQYHVS
jgi:hypothetical protein